VVEYDLDNDDEDWLEKYNTGGTKIRWEGLSGWGRRQSSFWAMQPPEPRRPTDSPTTTHRSTNRCTDSDTKFERMLWKLELACAEATEDALLRAGAPRSRSYADQGCCIAAAPAPTSLFTPQPQPSIHLAHPLIQHPTTQTTTHPTTQPRTPPPHAPGASVTERSSATALAAIDHLPKELALEVLLEVGVRDVIANDVYEYWAAKRRKWQKPMLRRLQAPTSASDTNPFNVFRWVGWKWDVGGWGRVMDGVSGGGPGARALQAPSSGSAP